MTTDTLGYATPRESSVMACVTLTALRRLVAGGTLSGQLLCAGVSPSAEQIRLREPASTEAPDAGFLTVWRDREARSVDLEDSQESEVLLALLPLTTLTQERAFSMVLRARYRSRYPVTPPGAVEIRVQVNPMLDPNRMRSPVMRLVLNEGTDKRRQLDLAGRVPDTGVVLPGGRVDVVFFTVPVGLQLLHLVNAETIEGQVFGTIDFLLTSGQIDALREFATGILSVGTPSRPRP